LTADGSCQSVVAHDETVHKLLPLFDERSNQVVIQFFLEVFKSLVSLHLTSWKVKSNSEQIS